MSIQHAIYASAQVSGRSGYQFVSQSEGIDEQDLKAIRSASPSHNGLNDARRGYMSFRLPSGEHCAAITQAAQGDYSGRGGVQAITHALVVPVPEFNRFAGNPFCLLEAAEAAGSFDITPPWPRSVAPFSLAGRCRLVDRESLVNVYRRVGNEKMREIVAATSTPSPVVFATRHDANEFLAAIISCLPLQTRQDVTMACGRAFQSVWTFDWVVTPEADRRCRHLACQRGATLVDVCGSANGPQRTREPACRTNSWADFVVACLANDQLDALERQLRMMQDPQDFDELDGLEAGPQRSQKSGRPGGPARMLAHNVAADAVLEQLELLDDTIFAAIDGDRHAVDKALQLWEEVVGVIDRSLLEESREQYLRYAITVYENAHDLDHGCPSRAAAAVEIIALLTGAH